MMGFREIKEIKSEEKITDRKAENQNYLKIKPESKMTMDEMAAFWAEEFRKAGEDHGEE